MKLARSVGAIALGFVLIGALSVGMDYVVRALMPDAFDADGGTRNSMVLLLTQLYVGVFATFGCYLAARVAGYRPMLHALVLGVLGLVLNIFALTQVWDHAPAWHNVLGLALVMVWAWLGGKLAEGKSARKYA